MSRSDYIFARIIGIHQIPRRFIGYLVITVKIVRGFNQTVTITKDQCHRILLIESYFIG